MRELDIARTPLREGVKRLALEGLIETRPSSGTYVTVASSAVDGAWRFGLASNASPRSNRIVFRATVAGTRAADRQFALNVFCVT